MKQVATLTHEFVEFIPEDLKEGVIYVSIPYATVAHKCCCGCGEEVVTPLSPTDWKLTFDGKTISLDPSIGNWSFPCQSHYWISNNQIIWAPRWSPEMVNAGRVQDRFAKEQYFNAPNTPPPGAASTSPVPMESRAALGAWQRFKKWWKNV
ncbi:MAG: hypothetical protein JST84_05485 [Acidobacteria bacterium]|nr:hypothetical protein [Acidobacteriota bacterium]